MNYELIDLEDGGGRPTGFEILPKNERLNLPEGANVKLGFLTGREVITAEFLWVKTESKEEGEDIYYGTLAEAPLFVAGLSIGASIQYTSKNILRIIERQRKSSSFL